MNLTNKINTEYYVWAKASIRQD